MKRILLMAIPMALTLGSCSNEEIGGRSELPGPNARAPSATTGRPRATPSRTTRTACASLRASRTGTTTAATTAWLCARSARSQNISFHSIKAEFRPVGSNAGGPESFHWP